MREGELFRLTAPTSLLVPLPWEDLPAAHTNLPDEQNLERVALHALGQVHPDLSSLVDRWGEEARAIGRVPSWKMLARFWNGLTHPKVSGQGFFDKVFGQDDDVAQVVRASLVQTRVWRGLTTICSV